MDDDDPRVPMEYLRSLFGPQILHRHARIVLVHDGFPVEEAKAGHGEGWVLCLDNLETHLG